MKLLHLYHDIMNLYGDYANVLAMQRILEKSGESVTVDRLSLGDDVRMSEYDFIYIGSGTEQNMHVVLEDFRRFRDDISRYLDRGGVMLLTGNSFEMLGRCVNVGDGELIPGVDLFRFATVEQYETRLTGDAVFECDFLDSPVVGFINKCSYCKDVSDPLFTVKLGLANDEGKSTEGFRYQTLFGTHLTGPVLMKNPHFLIYLAELVLGRKPVADHLVYEQKGYEVTLSELKKRMESEK